MKTFAYRMALAALMTAIGVGVVAQGFVSGSNGSMGELIVGPGGQNPTVLDVPPDGIFHFTTVRVDFNWILSFRRNALNTPVVLLATGDVVINGTVDVRGSVGSATAGGAGGPGGFDGGPPNGAGKGPGGGWPGGTGNTPDGAGVGAYAPINGSTRLSLNDGAPYGSALLVPLVGGSGGGGSSSGGGGGGGGAILIASSTRILVGSGDIDASGVPGSLASGLNFNTGWGSGGAIRLVAPVVEGTGRLNATGWSASMINPGRIRVDTIDQTGVRFNTLGLPLSIGKFMTVFPPVESRLRVVEITGSTIPEETAAPVNIVLPFGSDPNRNITVRARDFDAVIPVEIVLTPNEGLPLKVQTQIDNASANPASVTVPVTFPINTPVDVAAWVR